MLFETISETLPDYRQLVCWINRPSETETPENAVILTPGFGKRMHQHSALTQYFVANGIAVVRFDAVNHVGLSDGEIEDFTLSDGLISLEAATEVALRTLASTNLNLVATSLTARIALRRFSHDHTFSRLVVMSGVVDVRDTFIRVFGPEYAHYETDKLPEFDVFEGQKIRVPKLYQDGIENDWLTLSSSIREIERLDRPATWFVGTEDRWIDHGAIDQCSTANMRGKFKVINLENCGHDIGRNSAIARMMMRRIVEDCSSTCASGDRPAKEPSHKAILEAALLERRIQRGQQTLVEAQV